MSCPSFCLRNCSGFRSCPKLLFHSSFPKAVFHYKQLRLVILHPGAEEPWGSTGSFEGCCEVWADEQKSAGAGLSLPGPSSTPPACPLYKEISIPIINMMCFGNQALLNSQKFWRMSWAYWGVPWVERLRATGWKWEVQNVSAVLWLLEFFRPLWIFKLRSRCYGQITENIYLELKYSPTIRAVISSHHCMACINI